MNWKIPFLRPTSPINVIKSTSPKLNVIDSTLKLISLIDINYFI